MNRTRKTILSILVVSLVGGVVAFGTYAAFFSTTDNPGNSFATGTVAISDNDGGTALYTVSNAKPGTASSARCIRVTYTGSLGATVKLYRSAFTGGTGNLETEVDLAITKGTGTAGNCSDFSGSTSVYSGKLGSLGTDFTGGTALTNASSASAWATNDAVTYRVVASLPSGPDNATDNTRQNKATGTHSLIWEAQNN